MGARLVPSHYDPSWRAAHARRAACVVTTEADDEWIRLSGAGGAATPASAAASLDAKRAKLHEAARALLVEWFPRLSEPPAAAAEPDAPDGDASPAKAKKAARGRAVGAITYMHTLGPMARGLSHTGARYECAALRPHVATVDDLFLCGADIGAGAGECASELRGGWLCATR